MHNYRNKYENNKIDFANPALGAGKRLSALVACKICFSNQLKRAFNTNCSRRRCCLSEQALGRTDCCCRGDAQLATETCGNGYL